MHEFGSHPHEESLRAYARGFPAATEEWPWGHAAIKVRGKIFVMVVWNAAGLAVTAKLAESAEEALLLPFSERTGYGLGRHGWVTARFAPDQDPPLAILRRWIDESYRAVAPRKLIQEREGAPQRRRKA